MSEHFNKDGERPSANAHIHPGVLERFAAGVTNWSGRNSAFALAVVVVVGWVIAGPVLHFSDRWELFINTVTSIVTFLMVFVIQRAQNKDTLALQLKLNELISSHRRADNSLIAIERLSEDELRELHDRFVRIGASASAVMARDAAKPDNRAT